MVKKIEYYKCDCKVGTLEELSKTKMREPVFEGEQGWAPREASQTTFYQCDKCESIYKRDVTVPVSREQLGIEAIVTRVPVDKIEVPVPKDNIELYKGRLTEEEIIHRIPLFTGLIHTYEEDALVKARDEKKR